MFKVFTKISLLVFFILCSGISYSQFSITGQAGGYKFLGDVGKKSNSNFTSDMRLGYNFGVEYRIGKVLGIGVDAIYGKLAGTDNDKTSKLNFQSTVMGGGLNLFAFFDKLGEKEKDVSPYIHAGVGYLLFDAHGDLRDKNGTSYNYWSDGSIRNLSESSQNEALSSTIKRDHTYETQLKDSLVNYARNCLFIPLGIGAKFKMGFRSNLRIGAVYNLALTDYIDNYKKGGNDSWISANIGLNIHFGKKPKGAYSDVDFKIVDNADADADGVIDLNDLCQGTPKGIKVDGKGCPYDKDDDGIADYLDKEINSKRGALVDASGVTIDQDAMAKKQILWDSLSSERSDGFNNTPSLSYLKQVEEKAKSDQIKSGKVATIPLEFIESDYNKDGIISASEITKTIDGFFEGINSFNVEKINKLIDFFFEQ